MKQPFELRSSDSAESSGVSMIITKLERQKKNPSRISLHIDNKYAIGVHKEVLLKSGLRVGDRLTDSTLNDLRKSEELHLARESALRLLSYRARSKKEVRDRLKRKGISPGVVAEVIDAFQRSGLLDDLEFAKAFAHDQLMRKPMGEALLKQQLSKKGINKETIEQVLLEVYQGDTEDAYAFELASKRIKRSRSSFLKLDPVKQKKRLWDYLARRGFDWVTVRKVVERALGPIP